MQTNFYHCLNICNHKASQIDFLVHTLTNRMVVQSVSTSISLFAGLTLMAGAALPLCYQGEAFLITNQLINSLPTPLLQNVSPAEEICTYFSHLLVCFLPSSLFPLRNKMNSSLGYSRLRHAYHAGIEACVSFIIWGYLEKSTCYMTSPQPLSFTLKIKLTDFTLFSQEDDEAHLVSLLLSNRKPQGEEDAWICFYFYKEVLSD